MSKITVWTQVVRQLEVKEPLDIEVVGSVYNNGCNKIGWIMLFLRLTRHKVEKF